MGLVLTTAVPQTLGIGISLVRSCGGNEGLALMLTGGWALVAGACPALALPWHCPGTATYGLPAPRVSPHHLPAAHPAPAPAQPSVGTNIIGIFTMPLWLKALFSGTGERMAVCCQCITG